MMIMIIMILIIMMTMMIMITINHLKFYGRIAYSCEPLLIFFNVFVLQYMMLCY